MRKHVRIRLALALICAMGLTVAYAQRGGRLTAIDTDSVEWQHLFNEQAGGTFNAKRIFQDPDTGMEAIMVRYPAGFTNPWHTHNCAHGVYVLDGTLVTHEGRYEPGAFVWFPEGVEMQHGASDERDVTLLFVTNKPFDIHYR